MFDRLIKGKNKRNQLALQNAQLQLILSSASDFHAGWNDSGLIILSPGLGDYLSLKTLHHPLDIEASLTISDAAAFHTLIERLLQDGVGFDMTAALADDLTFCSIKGAKITQDNLPPFYILWIRDTTQTILDRRALEKNCGMIESERDRLQVLFDLFPRPLWLRDADMALQWCNQAYARSLEMTVQDAVQNHAELFVTKQDRTGHELAEKAHRSGKPQTELRPIVIKGERRLMEITEWPLQTIAAAPVSVSANAPMIAGFAFDQTRLDQAQAELNRHIKATEAVLQNMTTAIAVFSPDTRLRFFNHAYQLLMELDERWLSTEPTMNEILEALRDRRKLPEQSDFPRFKKNWLRFFNDLVKPHDELLHLPNGSALRMVVVPHPLGGLLFTFEDVTDRFTLEASYNTLIEVQRTTLNHLNEAVALFGADGRLRLWNPPFEAMWKWTPDQLANQPHITRLQETMRGFFSDADWSVAKNILVDKILQHNFGLVRVIRNDSRQYDVSVVPLPDGAVLCRFVDVTDSEMVEEALRDKTSALEAADRLKSDFLVNVSYQLRTPLNSIMGFAELLRELDSGKLNDRQLDYVGSVLTAAQHLQKLIDDILELASLEAGFLTLQLKEFSLCGMLNDVGDVSMDWVRKNNVNLHVECAEMAPVFADETRLKQAVLNLIGNAIKWTGTGGMIRVAAYEKDSKTIIIAVQDTGAGIAQADQNKLLMPFYSGQKRDRKSGAGLGLALVNKIMAHHGGSVNVTSAQGKGTIVTLELPRQV